MILFLLFFFRLLLDDDLKARNLGSLQETQYQSDMGGFLLY